MYVRDKELYKKRARDFMEAHVLNQQTNFGTVHPEAILEARLADMFYRHDQLQEELADYKRSAELAARIGIAAAMQVMKENNKNG